ncbi:leucine-rich PPR motif-containing protein, mitochondrial-like [Hylaeus volcanicus]|uniref:leucine-rich PPR motif-containing protein, mitochondrial-like n=1 Tax=Hylaeus volcanicus TaxID=313075 RepID=UPI0023B7AD07|nr:leucine-rich PPR motif-containing protein, mitochondrial-like [Hylaeus volcanicus]
MILIRKCKNLVKVTRMYTIGYGNLLTLTIRNLSIRNYMILSCRCMTRPLLNNFNADFRVNYIYVNGAENSQSFQYKVMIIHQNFNKRSIQLDNLKNIIDDLEKDDFNLSKSLSVTLIKCCGNMLPSVPLKLRQELTDRVWNLASKRKSELTIDHYHALLHAYIDNDNIIDPGEFLKSMVVDAQYDTYCLLLKLSSKSGDIASVETLISDMHKAGLPLDEEAYNTLVHVYAVNGDVTGAKKVMDSMVKVNIKPSPTTYAQLMYAFAKTNDIEALTEILSTTAISKSEFMKLVKFLSVSGNGVHIPDVLKFMQPLQFPDTDVIAVIIQLVHIGHFLDAYKIITQISISDTCKTIRRSLVFSFLKEVVALNSNQTVVELVSDLAIKHRIEGVWRKAVEFASIKSNVTLALTIFDKMKSQGMVVQSHYYWLLLSNVGQRDEESDIYLIIRHMINLNIIIDSKTFINHVFPYINTKDPVVTVQKMHNNGIACIYTVPPLVKFLLDEQRLQESINLCSTFKKKVDCQDLLDSLILNYNASKDINSCIQVLFDLSYNGRGFSSNFLKKFVDRPEFGLDDIKDTIQFLNTMKSHGVLMSLTDIQYIENKIFNLNITEYCKCSVSHLLVAVTGDRKIHNYNSGSYVHPQNMNKDQLITHLYTLKTAEKNTRGVLRKLFKIVCNENNINKVQEIAAEMKMNNFDWSPGMKAVLFSFYTKNKMTAEAMSTLHEIHSLFPQFQIDNFKILAFVILLVKKDKVDEAFNVIDCTNVNHKHNALNVCVQLLNLLAKGIHSNHTKEMIHLLVQKGYCLYSNVLRYLVYVPLLKGDIESAVNVFKQCAENYNITPAKQEILLGILKKSPSQQFSRLLDEVYTLIVQVHGKRKAIVNFAIALAQCNKKKELEILLKKEWIWSNLLLEQLKYLQDAEIVRTSLILLEVGGEILGERLEPICNLTLFIYKKKGKYEQAVNLANEMKKKGILPSKTFEKSLNELLTTYKLPISISTSNDTMVKTNETI